MNINANELGSSPTHAAQAASLLLPAHAPDPLHEAVDMTVLSSLEELQMEDEPDLVVELIDLYLTEAAHRLAAMQEALTNADELSLKRAAHSFRGSSANLGVQQVAALCAELEQTDHSDSFQHATTLLTRMAQEFAHAQEVFITERQRRTLS